MFRWPGVATYSTTTNLMPTFWNRSKTRTNWFLEVSQAYSRKYSLPAPSSSTMKPSYFTSSLSLSWALTSIAVWDIYANTKRRKLLDSKSTYLRLAKNARARTRMSSCRKRKLAARTSLRKQKASWIVSRKESSSISSSKMTLASASDQLMSSSNCWLRRYMRQEMAKCGALARLMELFSQLQ